MSLGRIVQQRGGQQVGIIQAGGDQASSHVERVAPVGDRHGREQGPGGSGSSRRAVAVSAGVTLARTCPKNCSTRCTGDQAPTRRSARP